MNARAVTIRLMRGVCEAFAAQDSNIERVAVLHIMLTPKKLANDPTDPLRRTNYGWDPRDSAEMNWANNHGYYKLGRRADSEDFVLFSFRPSGRIVMAGRIDSIVEAVGKPGKRIIVGKLVPRTHPLWERFIGERTPEHSLVRNPVTYPEVDW